MRRLALLAVLVALAGAALARRRRLGGTSQIDPATPRPDAGLPPVPSPYASVPWRLAEQPAADATLAIRCHQDDQLVLDRVDVQETPTQVFVTALARRQPRRGDEPARQAVQASVLLSRPLGGRELIATPVDAGQDAPPLYP